jgi:hypothetical protein
MINSVITSSAHHPAAYNDREPATESNPGPEIYLTEYAQASDGSCAVAAVGSVGYHSQLSAVEGPQNMKYLFVSLFSITPHFETELELMSDLLEGGHEVHVLRCTGQLGCCLANPEHRPNQCVLCVSKIDRGLDAIANPRLTVEVMPRTIGDPTRLQQRFDSLEELRTYSIDGAEIGRGASANVCMRFNKDTHLDTHRYASDIRAELESAYHVYLAVKDCLQRTRPDCVYLFNGRFSTSHATLLACKAMNVEFVTHERSGPPNRYVLRHNALPHDLHVIVREIEELWAQGGDDKHEIARRWYQDRRRGSDAAGLSFVQSQVNGTLPEELATRTRTRNIAIFNSTLEEYASIVGRENPIYEDEVVGLRRIVEVLAPRSDVRIYVRVHPHLKGIPRHDNYQLRGYGEIATLAKNVTFIWPESPVDTYALLEHCDVVLTFGSTVGAEASFWRRPSVLAGRAAYEGVDCCYLPRSHDELLQLLTSDLAPKPEQGALKYSYWEAMQGIVFKRFAPKGHYAGTFNGRPNLPSMGARVQSALLRTLGR